MKKIVHIGPYRPNPVGGVGKTILEQTRALAKCGIDVEIWQLGADCQKPTLINTEEVYPVWNIPAGKSWLLRLICFPKSTMDWINGRRGEIDLLHIHSVFTPANYLLSKIGIPYVITPNGGWSEEILQGRNSILKRIWMRLFENHLWKNASLVQAVSKREAAGLARLSGIASVSYIPNGTHFPDLEINGSSRSTVLYMGRYAVFQKGLDVLIQALESILEKLPDDFRLVMAGSECGTGRADVEAMIEAAGLSKFIQTHGPVHGEEKKSLFENARLFVHTSRFEGLPLVLLEALSYGIPCLLTPGTNVSEEWEHAGCAFSVPLSPREIGEKILELWNRDLSAESSNARTHVQIEYSWDKIAVSLINEYEKCLTKN